MPAKFILHSNIGGKERISIKKEDLDKLTQEDWAELNRRNVHVCIIGIDEGFDRKIIHPTIEEMEAQMRKSFEEETPGGTSLPDELILFE